MFHDAGGYSPEGAAESVVYPFPVLRMHQTQESRVSRLEVCGVLFSNSIDFSRPDHIHGNQIGFPAAYLGHGLGFQETGPFRLQLDCNGTQLALPLFERIGRRFACGDIEDGAGEADGLAPAVALQFSQFMHPAPRAVRADHTMFNIQPAGSGDDSVMGLFESVPVFRRHCGEERFITDGRSRDFQSENAENLLRP